MAAASTDVYLSGCTVGRIRPVPTDLGSIRVREVKPRDCERRLGGPRVAVKAA